MRLTLVILTLLLLTSCAPVTVPAQTPDETPIAFPGAEGFGRYTSGGRGGKVFVVTHLNDQGPGSLREAAEAKSKRIITFAVAGTIHLESPLSIRGDVTIAGQSAPGDGICIADHPVSLGGDNIILRYLRIRLGDRHQNKGPVPGSGHDDALGAGRRSRIIIDHCSVSWSTDECLSVYGGDSTTLQWNIIAEPLNYSYHFEAGDTDFEKHGFGGIWGGKHLSAHHNLFAHCLSRNPRFNGARLGSETDFIDFRNNVIYNWGHNSVYGGEGGTYNLVNNYYKYGPNTGKNVLYRIVNPTRNEQMGYGRFFVEGNYVDGSPEITRDNRKGVDLGKDAGKKEIKQVMADTAFPALPAGTQSARDAFLAIIEKGGCSRPVRDTLDQRILRNLFERNGSIIDVQGGYPHGTPYEQSRNAWPVLRPGTAPADTDRDGMPDEWEKKQGLNPNDPLDAGRTSLHAYYTNIEVYLNSLVQ
jgi:pectate lyase